VENCGTDGVATRFAQQRPGIGPADHDQLRRKISPRLLRRRPGQRDPTQRISNDPGSTPVTPPVAPPPTGPPTAVPPGAASHSGGHLVVVSHCVLGTGHVCSGRHRRCGPSARIVGEAGVLTTTDGGSTWIGHNLPASVGLVTDLACPTDSHCVGLALSDIDATIKGVQPYAGVYRFYRPVWFTTDNGGITWAESSVPRRRPTSTTTCRQCRVPPSTSACSSARAPRSSPRRCLPDTGSGRPRPGEP